MALITNGSVTYERRVKTGDFEHKQAAVVIHYALDQGEDLKIADLLIASAGQLATQHVFGMLRAKPGNDAGNGSTNGSQPPVSGVPSSEVGPAHRNPSTTASHQERPIEPSIVEVVEIDIGPALAPVTNLKAAKRAAAVKKAEKEANPPAVEDTIETLGGVVIPPTIVPSVAGEGIVVDVEDFTAVAPAPTDAELGQALSRVNAKLKDRARIMALIGEFVASGESYTKIPDVRRSEFLTRLNTLV